MNFRLIGAAAAALTLATTLGVGAQSMMMSHKLLPGVTDAPSRFSGPGVYTGQPALPVTLSMIEAGGGPK